MKFFVDIQCVSNTPSKIRGELLPRLGGGGTKCRRRGRGQGR